MTQLTKVEKPTKELPIQPSYRRSKGLPKQSVKYMTDKEMHEIYYNNYYKASGADEIENPRLAMYVFDTAVVTLQLT